MNQEIKTYNFSYGGTFKKFISKTISFIYNALIGTFFLIIFAFVIAEMNYLLRDLINNTTMNVLNRIEVYLGIVILSIFIIPSFFPQKVEISNDLIKIRRHCLFLSVFMISRGFNDSILISQITEVCRPKNKDKFFEPIPVNIIDWDNIVIIRTKYKYYYAPVEDSEKFIRKVNERVDLAIQKKNSNIKEQ